MQREKGSNTEEVEIVGGPYDGARGLVVEVAVRDGKRLTTVRLADGTVVTFAREEAGPQLPREQGS